MHLEVVVQKAAKKATALSEVRFIEILGSVLGLASSLNPCLSSKKHLRSFILINSRKATGHLFLPKIIVGSL